MTTSPTSSDPRDDSAALAVSTRPIDRQAKSRRQLSVSVVNFWLDATLLVLLSVQGLLAAILQFVFPRPTAAAGWTLWGLTFDQWHDVQFGSLCLLAFGVLIHVMMHWNWVCSVIATQVLRTRQRPDEAMQTIYGVATLIVILHVIAAGVIAAMLCVRRPPL